MKAVSAYTCTDPDLGSMYFVVTDSGKHVPYLAPQASIKKGDDLSGYETAGQMWLKELTNIQPVELPEAKS